MDFTDPSHKKIIGIIYIIFSALGLMIVGFYDVLMSFIFGLAEANDPDFAEVSPMFDIIGAFVWGIAILFLLPRLIIGIGLAMQQKWADIPGLVFGIISLLNFPLGTLLGVYAIAVFTAKKKE
ncbi:hypothetical protein BXY85_0026 [Roseivirga pacifica]|uniref:DUF4064 domain-containing protein n=1 Tax=Roseivirga pacifica TaxID=1267423 RepID=A0A1I0R5I0_9BACT|nr:hypothetical protein [Roseivirga pacifica]MCO6358413.1 hypothetical protein [Roseivirga pacifica]MCO6368968.1 hypothetical protein [Roseivirga pacifica]MCO6372328.1 hypothetical protein [Roseivirga pacifica]MCO6374144.1 hypothetical protein [Roseivirga pacifica]MCO6381059.1 hypothetical protein [Roseivirga pacifica]